MSRIDFSQLFPEWLESQQIALAAWRLQNPLVGKLNAGTIAPFCRYLEDKLDTLISEKRLHELSTLTLTLLSTLKLNSSQSVCDEVSAFGPASGHHRRKNRSDKSP